MDVLAKDALVASICTGLIWMGLGMLVVVLALLLVAGGWPRSGLEGPVGWMALGSSMLVVELAGLSSLG